MELLLTVLAVAAGLILARRGILHPGDYLVAASLAVILGGAVLAATPNELQIHRLIEFGAPRSALLRSEFLLAHGMKIALGSILFALGACMGAVVRRRTSPEQFAM